MVKIFFLIGKSYNLIESKIKEITSNFIILRYKNNFKDFLFELEKNLNQRIFGSDYDIVFKNLEELKENEVKNLIDLIKENKKIKFIFVFEKEPSIFFAYLRELKIKPQVFYLQLPKGRQIEKLISDYFEKNQIKLSKSFISLLKENYQENLEELIGVLEKLRFVPDLSLDELKYFFHFQTNSFKVHDNFLEKKWPHFIHSFKKFIFEDKSYGNLNTLQTMSFLFHSLIKIYLIKSGKRVSGKPFYLQKLQEKSKGLNLIEIKNLLSALAKTERKFKKFMIPIEEIPEDIYLNYLSSLS